MKIKSKPNFIINFGTLYGDDIPMYYLNKNIPLTEILELKFDDIWLALTYAIKERSILLKYHKNITSLLLKILNKDRDAKILFNNMRKTEGSKDSIEKIVQFVIERYQIEFEEKFAPDEKMENYIGDIIQLIGSSDLLQ
jgi:hypothetical protein